MATQKTTKKTQKKIIRIEQKGDKIHFTSEGFTNYELLGLLRLYEQQISINLLALPLNS